MSALQKIKAEVKSLRDENEHLKKQADTLREALRQSNEDTWWLAILMTAEMDELAFLSELFKKVNPNWYNSLKSREVIEALRLNLKISPIFDANKNLIGFHTPSGSSL